MRRFTHNPDGFSSVDESPDGELVWYDEHAADRAELVAQLEAANKRLGETTDDALKQRVEFWREACQKAEAALEAERADHDEFGQYKRAEALVAQVAELQRERSQFDDQMAAREEEAGDLLTQLAELTRERDEAIAEGTRARESRAVWEERCRMTSERLESFETQLARVEEAYVTEVARLTEALAAAEHRRVQAIRACDERESALQAAEARVRDCTDKLDTLGLQCDKAEARVEGLETLLAASEARAAQWKADAESYRADATVAQDRLAALKAKVERAVAHFTVSYGSSPYHWPEPVRAALEILRG